MTALQLQNRFHELCHEVLPAPGNGATAARHRRIAEIGQEDLSLAKLAEAHWDAMAILQEASHEAAVNARYAVWASERPGQELRLEATEDGLLLSGSKDFCSGAGLVNRALITAGAVLVEVDLTQSSSRLLVDGSGWTADAFRLTQTSTLTFNCFPVTAVIGEDHWYVKRPGFWRGAVGPAAAWAGGALGLLDYVMASKRDDPHTTAHRAAMHANIWVTRCVLDAAAHEFDSHSAGNSMLCALQARHAIEQSCTDTLRRFARCMGPVPLARDADMSRRYAELDMFLRQCHGERDLEALGRALREAGQHGEQAT